MIFSPWSMHGSVHVSDSIPLADFYSPSSALCTLISKTVHVVCTHLVHTCVIVSLFLSPLCFFSLFLSYHSLHMSYHVLPQALKPLAAAGSRSLFASVFNSLVSHDGGIPSIFNSIVSISPALSPPLPPPFTPSLPPSIPYSQ